MRIKILVIFGFASLALSLFGVFLPDSRISRIATPTAIVFIFLSAAFFISEKERKRKSD